MLNFELQFQSLLVVNEFFVMPPRHKQNQIPQDTVLFLFAYFFLKASNNYFWLATLYSENGISTYRIRKRYNFF